MVAERPVRYQDQITALESDWLEYLKHDRFDEAPEAVHAEISRRIPDLSTAILDYMRSMYEPKHRLADIIQGFGGNVVDDEVVGIVPKTPNVFLRDLRVSSQPKMRSIRTRCGVPLSPALRSLAKAIDDASWITSLEDDWDGQGSRGYDEATVNRVQRFLAENAQRMWLEIGGATPAPHISPGPEGSIDVQWKLRGRELLLNIPPAPEQYASYYGDNGAERSVVEGNQRIDEPATWMLMWLMNQ